VVRSGYGEKIIWGYRNNRKKKQRRVNKEHKEKEVWNGYGGI